MKLRGTARLLRWPLLVIILLIIFVELALYTILRLLVRGYEKINEQFRYRKLRLAMENAETFERWCSFARQMDQLQGRLAWRKDPDSPYYDRQLIESLVAKMQQYRRDEDVKNLMRLLRTVFSKGNIGGLDNTQLYSFTHFGTKFLIHDFIKEALEALVFVQHSEKISRNEKIEFFKKIQKGYGRSALILSGGASFGYFHLGVIKNLFEANCLPTVISGTSAGSMIASLVCTRTNDELPELFVPEAEKYFTACEEPNIVKLKRLIQHGSLFDSNHWKEKLRSAVGGDVTFEEAYRRTGRILNITTTSTTKYVPGMLLNYITSPNVVIWSAVLASCAVPSVLVPVELMEKDENGKLHSFHHHGQRWADGSIKNDIPLQTIAEKHNVNYFIVSQVQPHVIIFDYDSHGTCGKPSPHKSGSGLRGGFVSATLESYLRLEMRKWLSLIRDLDLLPMIWGQDLRYLFLQKTKGTINISPKPSLSDYWRIITDPDRETMEHYLRVSERNTWPKLLAITHHFIFEKTIRSCLMQLEHSNPDKGDAGLSSEEMMKRLFDNSDTLVQVDADSYYARTRLRKTSERLRKSKKQYSSL